MNDTLLTYSDRTVSKAPNGRATDIEILTHDGTLSPKNLILHDFEPTHAIKYYQNHIII